MSENFYFLIKDLKWCLARTSTLNLLIDTLNKSKNNKNKAIKGTKTISDYKKFIRLCTDELITFGKPMDHKYLIKKILDGFDNDYKLIIDVINGYDTLILFYELHEKLINKELFLHL